MSAIASSPTTSAPTPATFWPLVYRFAWKEVRKMRGFALGVAGLAFLLMSMAVYLFTTRNLEELRFFLLLVCAFGGGAFVAIGAATTAFSVEREEQTDTFLLTLPRYWHALFVGKFLAVCFLAVTFTVVMAAVAWILGGFGFPTKGGLGNYLQLGTVLLAEATAWGLVLSILVRRPLLAAVLACAATSFSSQLAMGLKGGDGLEGNEYFNALTYRWLLCGFALVIAMLLARRWVNRTESAGPQRRSRRWQFTEAIPATLQRRMAASAVANLQPIGATARRSIFWRLVWQTWRESWQVMFGVIGVGALLMISFELLAPAIRGRSPLAPLSLFFVPGLCGALVFRQDHRRGQHQFLTEHAGRPKLVWLARLFTWGTYLSLLSFTLSAITAWMLVSRLGLIDPNMHSSPWANIEHAEKEVFWSDFFSLGLPTALFATLLAFALGQLASLLLKSEILAAGLSLFASIGVMFYCHLIWTWRLPPIWCFLPIAVGAFAATYLRIEDWLAARSTPASWSRVAAVVIVPVIVVIASLPMIRHEQIEWALDQIALAEATSPQGGDVEWDAASGRPIISTAAARRQLDQFFDAQVTEFEQKQQAAELVTMEYKALLQEIRETAMVASALHQELGVEDPTMDVEETFRAEFSGISAARLERLIELTQEPVADNRHPEMWIQEVAWILDNSARKAISAGDLDLAWTRILALENFRRQLQSDPMARQTSMNRGTDRIGQMFDGDLHTLWALAPGLTPERIRNAVDDLIEISHQYPPLQIDVIADYIDARAILNGGSAANNLATPPTLSETALFLDQFPGEHARAELALRVFAMQTLQHIAVKSPASADNWSDLSYRTLAVGYRTPVDTTWRLQLWKTAASSLLANEIWNSNRPQHGDVEAAMLAQARRRLEQLRLLLIAYHLQNGSYPTTLDGLRPDYDPALFAEVTTDPYTGEPLHYAPRYFERMTWGDELWEEYATRTDYAAPLIWSTSGWNYGKYRIPIDLRSALPQEFHGKLESEYLLEGFNRIESHQRVIEANEDYDSQISAWQEWTPVLPLPNDNEYPDDNPTQPPSGEPDGSATGVESEQSAD